MSIALGQCALPLHSGATASEQKRCRNVRAWAARNVKDTFQGGTFPVLEKAVGASVDYRDGGSLLHISPEAGNFYTQVKDSPTWRFPALSWLSREHMKSALIGEGERINGVPNVCTYLACRLEEILTYVEKHDCDGMFTKQMLCIVPADAKAHHDLDVSQVSHVNKLIRHLVASATRCCRHYDDIVSM